MTFEKITYSGKKCNNYIYLSFVGKYFDPNKITKELNIQPTSTKLKGEPVPKRTSWKFQIDLRDEIDLETPTEKIIKTFDSKISIINKLKKELNLETRLQYVIDIDINPESSTPYFPMNKRTIKFLYETETEVDFDIFKADTTGLLKNE